MKTAHSADGAIASGLLDNSRLARVAAMGVPAFVRRAQTLEQARAALDGVLRREMCVRQRALLAGARHVSACLRAGIAVPSDLQEVLRLLKSHPEFGRRPCRLPWWPSLAMARLARGVRDFNRRWPSYVESVSLARVQALERAYNRYYPLERDFALRGAPPLRFDEIPLSTHADLLARFPLLPASNV